MLESQSRALNTHVSIKNLSQKIVSWHWHPVTLAKNAQTYPHYDITHKTPKSKTFRLLKSKFQDFPHF